MPIDVIEMAAVATLTWTFLNGFKSPITILVRPDIVSAILDFKYENKYYRFREIEIERPKRKRAPEIIGIPG
jgi:hypothetical protein